MTDQTFGARLKLLREQAGLSQSDLAERAGMNRFGVAKLEQGLRQPSWATVQALARALGLTCSAFEGTSADGADAAPEPPPEAPKPKRKPRKKPGTAEG